MEKLIYVLVLFFIIGLYGCAESASDSSGGSSSTSESESGNSATQISAYVYDGPCIAGANVEAKMLVKDTLAQTKEIYLATTGAYGYFEINASDVSTDVTPYALIKITDAKCHNEVTGAMMNGKTYYAMVDLTSTVGRNVHPQTKGTIDRTTELYTNPGSATYQNFESSQIQAEQEWMASYEITKITARFGDMALDGTSDGNAALLTMNAIHLQGNDEFDQAQFIQLRSDDIRFDGTLDDAGLIAENKANYQALNLSEVRSNLVARYLELGLVIDVPDFEPLVDSDGDGLPNGEDDDTPDAFSFTPVIGGLLNTKHESNIVTLSGLSPTGTTKITGEVIWNSVPTTNPEVVNGNTLQLKVTSDSNYEIEQTKSFVMNGVSYEYSVTTKADDRQQIIIFDSGQPSQDGDFGLANAQTWCSDQAIVNGLTGTIEPLLATDSDLMDIVSPDAINPRKVQSLWDGLVSSRWTKFLVDEGLQSFEDLGIVDTSYWAGRVVEAVPPNCNGWTSNGNGAGIADFGYYYLHDIANRSFQGDPRAIQNGACDQLKKILCIAY